MTYGAPTMNSDQKMAALDAIAECSLKMRKPGDWYVDQNTEIKRAGILHGEYGNGSTPQEAIDDHFRLIAESGEPIVTNAYGGPRRKVHKWNGYMWERVRETTGRTDPEDIRS